MRKITFILIAISLILAGCNLNQTPPPPTATTAPAATQPPPTDTVPTATPTEQVVYLAIVNGEGIAQAQFQASLMQFQRAQAEIGGLLEEGQDPAAVVMENLIALTLLSQAARGAGYTVDRAMLDERIAALIEQVGGTEALEAWMAENGYTQASFMQALKLEMEAAWQREQIFNTVPTSAEHVHAQQILWLDAYLAQRAYSQLESGASFETILANNDPNNYGYLGWVPRGYFLIPGIEEVVFSLQPGEYSEVIETDAGYHIFYVYEYDPDRPLIADALITLQAQALADWLAQQRAQSQIEILAP